MLGSHGSRQRLSTRHESDGGDIDAHTPSAGFDEMKQQNMDDDIRKLLLTMHEVMEFVEEVDALPKIRSTVLSMMKQIYELLPLYSGILSIGSHQYLSLKQCMLPVSLDPVILTPSVIASSLYLIRNGKTFGEATWMECRGC
jgi:hypothetical protein